MTDWWNVRNEGPGGDVRSGTEGERAAEEDSLFAAAEALYSARADPEPVEPKQETEPAPTGVPARARPAGKTVAGFGAAAVLGALVMYGMSGGNGGSHEPFPEESVIASSVSGNPSRVEGAIPVLGGESVTRESSVTLNATRAGDGRTGILFKVEVANETDVTITLMPNLFLADGHQGIVGEGTLAPGGLQVDPGRLATGTVEFALRGTPQQIVLTDTSGGVLATVDVEK